MSLEVYSRHGGSLLVAEHSVSEQTVRAALKQFDPSLILTWDRDELYQTTVWKVHKLISSDLPALPVLQWRENGAGRPLPLTSSLVDEVKRLREVDTAALVDAANRKHREAQNRQATADAQAIAEDHKPYVDRGRVQITTADTKRKPRRDWKPPQSAGQS